MNILKTFAGILLVSSSALSAIDLPNNIELSGAYRRDDFKSGENYFGSGDEGDPAGLTKTDLYAEHINVSVLGARARLMMPQLDCLCNYGFLENLYLKGYGYWGEDEGDSYFKDQYINVPDDQVAPAYGKLSSYRTYDWQIGLGYLFDLGSCCSSLCGCSKLDLGLGIIGGYSWSKQKLRTKRGDSFQFDGLEAIIDDPIYRGLKWSSEWKGGWLGAELYYAYSCDVLFNLGYEYHWNEWLGTFSPNQAALDVGGYTSERRKSTKSHANVVYFDATYTLCGNWEISAEYKYAYYKAKDGHVTEKEITGLNPRDARATLQTWQVLTNIGYNF